MHLNSYRRRGMGDDSATFMSAPDAPLVNGTPATTPIQYYGGPTPFFPLYTNPILNMDPSAGTTPVNLRITTYTDPIMGIMTPMVSGSGGTTTQSGGPILLPTPNVDPSTDRLTALAAQQASLQQQVNQLTQQQQTYQAQANNAQTPTDQQAAQAAVAVVASQLQQAQQAAGMVPAVSSDVSQVQPISTGLPVNSFDPMAWIQANPVLVGAAAVVLIFLMGGKR